mgnify:CR=1 FL=1
MKKHRILLLTLLILLLGLVWSVYSSRYRLQITYDSLTSSSLPRGFDGYRIVQLTDLHAAEFGENNCKLVEKIQSLRPDMISMTGDFIEQESDISVTETLIAQLTDIAPVYVVSGNHDWASGAANELRAAIESAGGVWLGNSCRELTKNNDRIILAGDSAGGGLVLALAMYLRDQSMPLPKKLVMMSPWTDLTASGPSYQENYENDPLFGNTRESMIYNGEYAGKQDPKHPYISPLFGDFHGLPPMLFQVGSLEMLLSDSVLAAQKAKEAGCDVTLTVYQDMFHVFQLSMDKLAESRAAWDEVAAFLGK